jgi:anti-anti-sigma factor
MQTTTETHGGVRVIHIDGHFTDGRDTDLLRDALNRWLEDGERLFVLDMAGCELLNSIGLGGMVSGYTSCARHGGTLKLCGLNERNRRAAYVSRILDLFEDHPDVASAVASFAQVGEA